MPTFAHIEAGIALDPSQAPDALSYALRFRGTFGNGAQVLQVPDGTQHGATQGPNGTWVNPIPYNPDPQPLGLSGKAFTTYVATVLSQVNNLAADQGLVRFGQIIASMDASSDPLTVIARKSYQAALGPGGKFTVSDATTLLAAISANGSLNTVTGSEATAIIANWPKG